MGYVAYFAATLITAIVIHAFHRRHQDVQNRDERPGDAIIDGQVSRRKQEGLVAAPFVPPVMIAVDQHEEEQDTVTTSMRSVKDREGDQNKEKDISVRPPSTSHTNAPVIKLQQQAMRPPVQLAPAPDLNSAAEKARQAAAMPPPSSLPPSRGRSPPRLKPAMVSSPPIPPRYPQTSARAPLSNGNLLAPPRSAASGLRVPQQKVLANTHMQPSLSTSTQAPEKRSSRRIILAPGHSALDWAALTRSTSPDTPTKLRGTDASTHLGPHRMGRIMPSQLKHQTGRRGKDAWTSYQGRVYNISAYLDFHPGGRDELMKGAGRSSDTLFAEVHPWVNWEGMLGGCLIGMLVQEDDPGAMGREEREEEVKENELDEMD